MPKKFDQDAKERVARHVEDQILAENMSMQEACWRCGTPFDVKASVTVVSRLTRLMLLVGLSGTGKGGVPVTTRNPKGPDMRTDLVNREFRAPDLNRLRVVDITFAHRKASSTAGLSMTCTLKMVRGMADDQRG